jgi:Holliday junction resolvasome RuvABC endonuclease subunit
VRLSAEDMRANKARGIVLGFKPTSHGFGWAAFSSPLSIHDWGLSEMKKEKNAGCLRKLEKLISRLDPQVIVLEAFDGPARRSPRVNRLCRAVVALAQTRNVDVAIYTRGQIKACFGSVGAQSRQEIAEAIGRSFDVLRHRLPPARRPWEGPHRRMAIFDAAAAIMTHYQLEASSLFEDLLGEQG